MTINPESIYPVFDETTWVNQWEKHIDLCLMNTDRRRAATRAAGGREIIRICLEYGNMTVVAPETAKFALATKYRDVGWDVAITRTEGNTYFDLYVPVYPK